MLEEVVLLLCNISWAFIHPGNTENNSNSVWILFLQISVNTAANWREQSNCGQVCLQLYCFLLDSLCPEKPKVKTHVHGFFVHHYCCMLFLKTFIWLSWKCKVGTMLFVSFPLWSNGKLMYWPSLVPLLLVTALLSPQLGDSEKLYIRRWLISCLCDILLLFRKQPRTLNLKVTIILLFKCHNFILWSYL